MRASPDGIEAHDIPAVVEVYSNSVRAWFVGLVVGQDAGLLTVRFVDGGGERKEKSSHCGDPRVAYFGSYTGWAGPPGIISVPSSTRPGQYSYLDPVVQQKFATSELAWQAYLERNLLDVDLSRELLPVCPAPAPVPASPQRCTGGEDFAQREFSGSGYGSPSENSAVPLNNNNNNSYNHNNNHNNNNSNVHSWATAYDLPPPLPAAPNVVDDAARMPALGMGASLGTPGIPVSWQLAQQQAAASVASSRMVSQDTPDGVDIQETVPPWAVSSSRSQNEQGPVSYPYASPAAAEPYRSSFVDAGAAWEPQQHRPGPYPCASPVADEPYRSTPADAGAEWQLPPIRHGHACNYPCASPDAAEPYRPASADASAKRQFPHSRQAMPVSYPAASPVPAHSCSLLDAAFAADEDETMTSFVFRGHGSEGQTGELRVVIEGAPPGSHRQQQQPHAPVAQAAARPVAPQVSPLQRRPEGPMVMAALQPAAGCGLGPGRVEALVARLDLRRAVGQRTRSPCPPSALVSPQDNCTQGRVKLSGKLPKCLPGCPGGAAANSILRSRMWPACWLSRGPSLADSALLGGRTMDSLPWDEPKFVAGDFQSGLARELEQARQAAVEAVHRSRGTAGSPDAPGMGGRGPEMLLRGPPPKPSSESLRWG
ncbi:unnamed protein product [Polarella glacialis]|uniref:Uncharacterized protein n=1 Tax=Polarella glacialis TaxID=89957 RepID=A0A813DC51_POLGL|nr:unnamed protein product [Polarella glacialis]